MEFGLQVGTPSFCLSSTCMMEIPSWVWHAENIEAPIAFPQHVRWWFTTRRKKMKRPQAYCPASPLLLSTQLLKWECHSERCLPLSPGSEPLVQNSCLVGKAWSKTVSLWWRESRLDLYIKWRYSLNCRLASLQERTREEDSCEELCWGQNKYQTLTTETTP